MPINSRAKGHEFERQVCNILNKRFNIKENKHKFKRVPLSGGFDKENFPGDLYSLNRTRFADNWAIECKFYKDWKLEDLFNGNDSNIMKWWTQASDDAKIGDKLPLLVFKKNHSQIYFMCLEEDIRGYFSPSTPIPKGILTQQNAHGLLRVGMFEEFLTTIEHYDLDRRQS